MFSLGISLPTPDVETKYYSLLRHWGFENGGFGFYFSCLEWKVGAVAGQLAVMQRLVCSIPTPSNSLRRVHVNAPTTHENPSIVYKIKNICSKIDDEDRCSHYFLTRV